MLKLQTIRTQAAIDKVYCPLCTHTVEARVDRHPRKSSVQPGQKCPHCSGSLDAGYILQLSLAA